MVSDGKLPLWEIHWFRELTWWFEVVVVLGERERMTQRPEVKQYPQMKKQILRSRDALKKLTRTVPTVHVT